MNTCITDLLSWEKNPRKCLLIAVASIILIHSLAIIFYRLFLSPIATFPGPKIAAATGLYENYFNFIKNGKYVFEVARLHDKYGPIVRVNPHELSIRDADFYDKLYVASSVRKTESYNHFASGVDFEGSHFLTVPHDLHRIRRKPLEPYFSRMGISQFEPVVHELVEKCINRFEKLQGTNAVVHLDHVMVCFTSDIISRVCCDDPTYLLDDENFSADWYESLHTIIKSMPLFEALPWIIRVIRFIPKSLLLWMDPRSQLFNDWRDMAERHILQLKKEKNAVQKPELETGTRRMTLLRHLVNSSLPESELSTQRLINEAQVLLGAGTIGTARVLDLTCYYIMSRPEVRNRMAIELEEVMADWPAKKPTWFQLEKLPYFQAVIKESLRVAYGVMRRLPRVSPDTKVQYGEWSIPAGTPVGMSAYMQHTNPVVFPRPYEFVPDRWMPENLTPEMNRNLVPFAKGSRGCLGMNLAYAEMNHILAALFRKDGPRFELYKTDESDVSLAHDFIVPLPRVESDGVRVIFK